MADCGDVEEVGQIGMARQGVALLAFHQNFYSQNAGYVGGERLYQRCDGELFGKDSGTVTVSEGGVDVNDREAGIDEINAANLRAGGQGMGEDLSRYRATRARRTSSARCWRTDGMGICAD